MRKQHEKPAGDRQILLEMQELVAVAEPRVKQDRGGDAEAREQQRGDAGLIAEQDQKAAAELDRDRERQQSARDAERLHVGDRRR